MFFLKVSLFKSKSIFRRIKKKKRKEKKKGMGGAGKVTYARLATLAKNRVWYDYVKWGELSLPIEGFFASLGYLHT